MTNRNFIEVWDGFFEEAQIVKIQIMAGIYAETQFMSNFCRIYIRLYSYYSVLMIVRSIGFCIKFYPICANFFCSFHHPV